MDDSLYHSVWRMDWGLGNPNKTAALIATLMIGAWGLAHFRKWGFWVALSLFTGLGACLILTLSRGGLVGLVLGSSFVLAWMRRPLSTRHHIAVIIACAILAVFALAANAPSRY